MKNSRRFKKVASFATAALMAACMAAPITAIQASAAVLTEGGNSITIQDTVDGATHTYEAYQVFSGVNTDGILTEIQWGDGVDGDAILTELQKTTAFAAATDAKSVAKILGEDNTFDNATAQAFAKVVGKHLTTQTSGNVDDKEIKNLPDGYYLVQDASSPTNPGETNPNSGAKTRYILKVANGESVIAQTKNSAPEVMKKVYEDDKTAADAATINTLTEADNKWNDVADYSIGEAVPFKLYGTMPSTINDYEHYYYKFTDTLGTEFDAPVITGDNSTLVVKVGDVTAVPGDGNCRASFEDGVLTVSFEDVKAYGEVNASTVVTVEYKAVLNKNAVIGLPGQENKVYLTYSNNPNLEYNPNTGDENEDKPKEEGKTPEDKVIVFTYEVDVNKVDENNVALKGAKFVLKNADGKYANVGSDGKLIGWVDTETILPDLGEGEFKIAGLDDKATYTLEEIEAPAGYNKLEYAYTVVLDATTANNQTWSGTPADALTGDGLAIKHKLGEEGSEYSVDTADKGKEGFSIQNQKGSTLPSTGGMGTTLFYVGGGLLAAGAGVLLITKKRTKKD